MAFGYAVYFSERAKNHVIRWDPDAGSSDVVAGEPKDGDPQQKLSDPYGLAMDSQGNLLIADKLNHRICRLRNGRLEPLLCRDATGHRAPRPDSPPGRYPLPLCPTGLAVEAGGSLLCTFSEEGTLYRIRANGDLELVLGIPPNRRFAVGGLRGTVPAADVSQVPLDVPTSIVHLADGTIFMIEGGRHVVRRFDTRRGLSCVFAPSRAGAYARVPRAPERSSVSEFHPAVPTALALDTAGKLYVTDGRHGCVLKVDLDAGTVERVVELQGRQAPRMNWISALAFGPDGTAWVLSADPARLQAYKVSSGGSWTPSGKALDAVNGKPLLGVPGGAGLVAIPA